MDDNAPVCYFNQTSNKPPASCSREAWGDCSEWGNVDAAVLGLLTCTWFLAGFCFSLREIKGNPASTSVENLHDGIIKGRVMTPCSIQYLMT